MEHDISVEGLWISAVVMLALPVWAIRRGGGAKGRFRWGLFLPLYMTGVGQPFAWLLERLATGGRNCSALQWSGLG